eukprot:GHVN01050676.1.p1 GENE.GHVN01050676.1~~GHVN01050676.1.p1  ORF type:complete len:116 (+),score=15.17 GHVN01050676.1:527-874(+)
MTSAHLAHFIPFLLPLTSSFSLPSDNLQILSLSRNNIKKIAGLDEVSMSVPNHSHLISQCGVLESNGLSTVTLLRHRHLTDLARLSLLTHVSSDHSLHLPPLASNSNLCFRWATP